jgi:hypothetical protein
LGLFYFDSASGKVAKIASVQSCQGVLYPPNVLVFSNVLSDLKADLMLVWATNGYEQNLVLKQCPPRPEAFALSSATTRLQFWSVMDACPVPQEQRPVLLSSGLVDHILIFSDCWFPLGSAFLFGSWPMPAQGQPAPIRVVSPSAPGNFPVAKSLVSIAGQTVLIEEINYTDLVPTLSALPQAALTPSHTNSVELAERGQWLPRWSPSKQEAKPISVASTPYATEGVVLDYTTLTGNTNGYTFATGNTYYIPNSYNTGSGTVTFQSGACIKFGHNGANTYLLTYGPVSFSYSGPPVVFTSKDDNNYGDRLPNSTSQPGYSAAQELWLYYDTIQTTVQNALFRWAQRAVQYDENSVQNYPSVSYCAFQDCQTGIYANLGWNDTLILSGDTYCNVLTPVYTNAGSVSGSMTHDCGVVSVATVNDTNRDLSGLDTNKNSQSECSFVIPDSSTVVAAFWNTHLSQFGTGAYAGPSPGIFSSMPSPRSVGWATSSSSGAAFEIDHGPIPPYSASPPMSPVATNGDSGDPVMDYAPGIGGANGTIYLLVNPSRNPGTWNGFRLWSSTDKGTNFNPVNMDVPGGVTSCDKPMIKVSGTNIYVAGTYGGGAGIWAAHSGNGGNNWDTYGVLDTSSPSSGADIAIATDGTVYVVWLEGSGPSGGPYVNKLRYTWLPPHSTSWSASYDFGITLGSRAGGADVQLLRSKTANTNDYTTSFCLPRIAIANNRVYVVYSDLPPNWASTGDRGDIFLAEAAITPGQPLPQPLVRQVNNDGTTTDQWDPSVAVSPSGAELFIGYYSRQNDPNTNSLIMAYGAKANIAGGLGTATFDCIPVSVTSFPPLFAGTTAPQQGGWAYDPVFPQACVCLNSYAKYDGFDLNCAGSGCSGGDLETAIPNNHFSADDYTWVSADGNNFYFAWRDCSRTFGTAPNIRPDADVKFAKIKQ